MYSEGLNVHLPFSIMDLVRSTSLKDERQFQAVSPTLSFPVISSWALKEMFYCSEEGRRGAVIWTNHDLVAYFLLFISFFIYSVVRISFVAFWSLSAEVSRLTCFFILVVDFWGSLLAHSWLYIYSLLFLWLSDIMLLIKLGHAAWGRQALVNHGTDWWLCCQFNLRNAFEEGGTEGRGGVEKGEGGREERGRTKWIRKEQREERREKLSVWRKRAWKEFGN